MDDDHVRHNHPRQWHTGSGAKSGTGFAYILAMIGAAVYYLQHAATFSDGIIGVLKALVWPAFLVYHLLGLGT